MKTRALFIIGINVLVNVIDDVISAEPDFKKYDFHRSEVSNISFPGKRLVGHVYNSLTTKRQVIHCAYECLKSSRCRSFNFEHLAHTCDLNDADHVMAAGSLQDEAKGTSSEYFQRAAFSIEQEALGPCAHDPCENGGRCLDTVNHNMERTYFCICTDQYTGENCAQKKNLIDWDNWENWGPCSITCEQGWTTRRRRCIDVVTSEELPSSQCIGRNLEYKSCVLQSCPRWLQWSEWGSCSTEDTCGRGVKLRHRKCSNGGVPGEDRWCLGFSNQSAPCEGINCRGMLVITDIRKHGDGRVEVQNDLDNSRIALCADQGWNHSEIDVVCRQIGFQGAAENATSNHYPMNHLVPGTPVYRLMCSGSEKTIQACRREPVENCLALAGMMCKIKGGWSLWTGWSECSVTCEDGQRTRTRACNHPPPNYGGTSCPGDHVQYTPCTEQMCPMDGVWNAWTAWNECSYTCGYGNRNRSRTCRGPFHDGAECPGLPDDVETCNAFSCPVDGSWKLWGTWGECSTTCGGGLRNRSRECDQPKHGGDYCAGPSEQAEVCNDIACPIDGVFTDWSEWYTCDVTCGGGMQWKNRSCIGPFNGGVNCSGDYDERQDCNTHECPEDGIWLAWQPWQVCSTTCGEGKRLRSRTCDGPYFGGDECPGNSDGTEICATDPCSIPGLWHEWSIWSLCTVTCGGGTRHRSRTCDVTSFGNLTTPCEGPSYEEDNCHTYPCLPLAIHCADWASRGLNQSCIADVDPDGEQTLFGPVQVECDFNTKLREAITVLHHDQEKRTQVKGYEEAGEYQVTLNYVTGWREAIKIVDSSKECAQFMRWDCKAAIIHNPSDPETLTTFWMNRTGQKANYFGGGSPGSGNCACGETRSCFNTSLHCNCDENDEVWRHDEGFVTNKDELPIHTFHAGDTGGSAEDGFLTIGPILCTGHA